MHLELRAGEPFVRVKVDFENPSRDHRVRFHIPVPEPVDGSAAEGQFAVVERGLTIEGGHGEVPLPTFPAHGFVSVEGVSVLLEQVTEYEVVEGRELALTLLRSFGLISRNANPYREDPAGPEVPVPAAQLLGERASSFAILPHRGGWLGAGTADWAERYRHPVLAVRGVGPAVSPAGDGGMGGASHAGLHVDGATLTALRRREGWLELRVVRLQPDGGPVAHPAPARERPGARGAGRRPARASRGPDRGERRRDRRVPDGLGDPHAPAAHGGRSVGRAGDDGSRRLDPSIARNHTAAGWSSSHLAARHSARWAARGEPPSGRSDPGPSGPVAPAVGRPGR